MTLSGEAEWLAAARGGSAPAFGRLVDLHQGAVRGFLRRTCGDHHLADDLAQEAFVTAWSRLAIFRAETSFRAWLCGIAYRKWLTHARAEGRRARREAEDGALAETAPAAPDARLDAAAILAVLPPEQRACVVLCLAAELSHAEAAQALGLPLGTIKSHVARGRAKLLQRLGGSDERS